MRVKINKLPKSQIELEIEVSAEELDRFIEKACFNLGRNLEIKGFRKGKAPKEFIEKEIGKEKILIEAANLAVEENYRKAVLENKIEAVFQPKIEIKKLALGNPFIFSAKTAVLPEVSLPDYKKIASKVERKEISVEDKEIGPALKWLQRSRAKFSAKNQPAQKGDFVEIEYNLSRNKDKELGSLSLKEPSSLKDAFILGEGHFLQGFEEKIIGMKSGEEKENITLNKDGKDIVLKVKIISVQNVEFPELNDEFAKSAAKFDNLDALKKNIKQGLVLEKEQAEKQRLRQEILERIGEKAKIEIPDVLIENEQKQMLENLKKIVSERLNPVRDSEGREKAQKEGISNGVKISFHDYLKKLGKTEEQVSDSFLLESQKKVRNYLILREISKKELDSEEIKKYTTESEKIEKIFQLLEEL
ncbi:trigger factor [Patescibacteria group bacterium]|nr:trigger factor [Patescibacteria group bacterium]